MGGARTTIDSRTLSVLAITTLMLGATTGAATINPVDISTHTGGAMFQSGDEKPPLDARAVAISAGPYHACAVLEEGNVQCWGDNSSGQAAGYAGRDAEAVSAGNAHTCILLTSGDVTCYGQGRYGRTGNYTGGDATNVSAGGKHTCIRVADGNVICYGDNWYGQAEDYTGGDAIAISTGWGHTCILLDNGSVDCYGWNEYGQSEDYTGGRAIDVSAGGGHTCVLLTDGNAHCYGANRYGQAEDYTSGDAIAVAAGSTHTCVLTNAGTVNCWGDTAHSPAREKARMVTAGVGYTCILSEYGHVPCHPTHLNRIHGFPGGFTPGQTTLEATIRSNSGDITTPPLQAGLVDVKAGPAEHDEDYYSIDVAVNETALPTVTLFTGGTLQDSHHVDLLDLNAVTISPRYGLTVTVRALFDPSQSRCLAEIDDTCAAPSPLNPFDPDGAATATAASIAFVTATVTAPDGLVVHEVTVPIPLAGQAAGGTWNT